MFASCKNCITVGSINKDQVHSSFSSMGPTPDGRLKPDLSAVGSQVKTVNSSLRGVTNGYAPGPGFTGGFSGTSAAAPVVTGIVALMLQQYARTFGVNLDFAPPLPSTSKAILIETATDLVGSDSDSPANLFPTFSPPTPSCPFPCIVYVHIPNYDTGQIVAYGVGPDWVTGYGSVNAQAAVKLIRDRQFLEGALDLSHVTDEFFVKVTPGQTPFAVTLAWDDPAGSPNANDAAPQLVNDLDLELIEPDGTVHRPLVLPPLTPLDCDGNPANGLQFGSCPGTDPITQNDLGAAAEGLDRLNNVEQVVVQKGSRLTPGCWKVRVSVLNLNGTVRLPLGGAQPYSLAGIPPAGSCGGDGNHGRMTGGGVFTSSGVRVTHGFELHCTATDSPNNLEVNWDTGNFHLTSLTSARCLDDPTITPNPPAAGFDTYVGSGLGRCNGSAASATWTFTDAGEPGGTDSATINIAGIGCSLVVSGKLQNGNQQAHP